jgi:hypothetical protein
VRVQLGGRGAIRFGGEKIHQQVYYMKENIIQNINKQKVKIQNYRTKKDEGKRSAKTPNAQVRFL